MKDGFWRGWDAGRLRTWALLGGTGVLALVVANLVGSGPAARPEPVAVARAPRPHLSSDRLLQYQESLSGEIASVLARVRGAGQVTVTLQMAGAPSLRLAEQISTTRQSTTERDSAGGTQTVQSSTQNVTPVLEGQGSSPVVVGETGPRVIGAVAVASGAGDPVVRQELTEALETLLGLPANQVLVLPGGGRR